MEVIYYFSSSLNAKWPKRQMLAYFDEISLEVRPTILQQKNIFSSLKQQDPNWIIKSSSKKLSEVT